MVSFNNVFIYVSTKELFGYDYSITFVNGVGNEILADTWALDTRGSFTWDRLNPSGNQPSGRMLVI